MAPVDGQYTRAVPADEQARFKKMVDDGHIVEHPYGWTLPPLNFETIKLRRSLRECLLWWWIRRRLRRVKKKLAGALSPEMQEWLEGFNKQLDAVMLGTGGYVDFPVSRDTGGECDQERRR